MRIFLAGATGALGSRLVPQLVAAGHTVVGTHPARVQGRPAAGDRRRAGRARPARRRRRARRGRGRRAGRAGAPADRADRDGQPAFVRRKTSPRPTGCAPRAPISCSPPVGRPGCAGWSRRASAAGRTPATGGLVEGRGRPARPDAGVRRRGQPGRDPARRGRRWSRTARAWCCATAASTGPAPRSARAARTSTWSGPASSRSSATVPGIWSFCHIDDAASATVAAIERGAPGVYNVADDEPAPVREWLPVLAAELGAPPPRHVPAWLARPLVGGQGMVMMTTRPGHVQREGEAGARLDPGVPELAGRVPRSRRRAE